MHFIDRIRSDVESHNKFRQYRRIANRDSVVLLHASWSSGPRMDIKATKGEWQGKRYIIDVDQPLILNVYGRKVGVVDVPGRTFTYEETPSAYTANAMRAADLRPAPYYELATRHDPGAWVTRCDGGLYVVSEGMVLRWDAGERLPRCDDENRRMLRTVISPESTAYVRALRKRLRNAFRSMDMLRRDSDPTNGPYSVASMKKYFDMTLWERTKIVETWLESGEAFDDEAYRVFLAGSIHYSHYYTWGAFGRRAEEFFATAIRRVSNAVRRQKFHTLV